MSQSKGNHTGRQKEIELNNAMHYSFANIAKDKQYLNTEQKRQFFSFHKLNVCRSSVILFILENNIKIYLIHASFYYGHKHRQTPDLLLIKTSQQSPPLYCFIENACQGDSGTKLPAQFCKPSLQSEIIRDACISPEFCSSFLHCQDSIENGSFINTVDDIIISNEFECRKKVVQLLISNGLEKEMYQLNELGFCKNRKLFKNDIPGLIRAVFEFFDI